MLYNFQIKLPGRSKQSPKRRKFAKSSRPELNTHAHAPDICKSFCFVLLCSVEPQTWKNEDQHFVSVFFRQWVTRRKEAFIGARVARFVLIQYTKMGKLYQMSTECTKVQLNKAYDHKLHTYTKLSKKISKFSIPRTSKIRYFWVWKWN
jgi:hypothetical protein